MTTLTDKISECLAEWRKRARVCDMSIQEGNSLTEEVDFIQTVISMRKYQTVGEFIVEELRRPSKEEVLLSMTLWDDIKTLSREDLFAIMENSIQNINHLIQDSRDYYV